MPHTRTKQRARILQDATGASYMQCLNELKRRSQALKDGVLTQQDQSVWWDRVDALPDPTPETIKCPRCLQPNHGKGCSS